MRFKRNISVPERLILSFLAVILLSWVLSAVTFESLMTMTHRDMDRRLGPQVHVTRRGEMPAEQGPGAGPRPDDGAGSGGGPHGGSGGGGGWPPPERGLRLPPPFGPAMLFPAQLALALVLSLLAGAVLSRLFTKRLGDLSSGAEAFQDGRLDHRIPEGRADEFASVARTMNAMAARLEHQIAALEDDARRRQQLLADLAHELRSPVATLKMMAEALKDGLAEEPTRKERALAATTAAVDRLDKLVSDMLVIARLDLHQLPLACRPLDLREAVRVSLEGQRARAEEAGITLHPVEDGSPAAVSADPMRLAQVFDNVIGNAVSHAGEGAEVTVRVEKGPPCVVEISDTGRGIAPEQVEFVFDPFYRVDSSRTPTTHHAGLGLRIARGLVEEHGGTIGLNSVEGEGTTVTVTLPGIWQVEEEGEGE
jgi:two-component system, OmpR family, sensor histidine kinase BaeS